ncbi:NFACT family protein [Candidatus Woesearchaeota archaeon]|nr:NFACT family protein [Candidatus Woesearchaeota archaeon]
MKGLSWLELRHVVAELQTLVGARVSKIHQPSRDDLYLVLFKTGDVKRTLRVALPSALFLTDSREHGGSAPDFCMALRKHLSGAVVHAVTQPGSERIVEVLFDTKEGRRTLVLELFAKGNILLCDAGLTIVAALTRKAYRDRTVRPRQAYARPPSRIDASRLPKDAFIGAMRDPSFDAVVKRLAVGLGFGKLLAEEICLRAGVTKLARTVDDDGADRLFSAYSAIIAAGPAPLCVLDGKQAVDAVPFPLQQYGHRQSVAYGSFSAALAALWEATSIRRTDARLQAYEREVERLRTVAEKQRAMLDEYQARIAGATQKGEAIYLNYTTVNAARESFIGMGSFSDDERGARVREHPRVVSVDARRTIITLDLS